MSDNATTSTLMKRWLFNSNERKKSVSYKQETLK